MPACAWHARGMHVACLRAQHRDNTAHCSTRVQWHVLETKAARRESLRDTCLWKHGFFCAVIELKRTDSSEELLALCGLPQGALVSVTLDRRSHAQSLANSACCSEVNLCLV